MDNWITVPLADCGEWLSGGTPSKQNPEYWEGTIPWVSPKDMNTYFIWDAEDHISEDGLNNGSRLVAENTILFVVRSMRLANEFQIAITERDVAFNQDLKAIRCYDFVDPRFLFYSLRAHSNIILGLVDEASHGTKRLKTDAIGSLEISMPRSLNEQAAIAQVAGTLDDKIELNRRENATLEAMARAIFTSWFVDFDPVYAKASGEQPSGMDAATAALFPDSFEESALGTIPAGWRVLPIAELTAINDWTLRKQDELERIEYIEISQVTRGDVGEIAYYDRGDEPSRARRRLQHGDTVLSTVRPDRGAYFLCLDPSPHLIASTGFAVITPVNIPWSFVYAALTQPAVSEYLGNLADGGAYPAVRPEIIGEWTVSIPDNPGILSAFHNICLPLYELADHNRRNGRTLAALRDTLLPRLISGELRVPELNDDWHAFIERTAGSLADNPIQRWPQGDYDERDALE